MLGIAGYGAFIAAAAALCVTPGIDTVYILTRTIARGRPEGVASALGINTGLLIHTVLVACGLSLVLAASPVAFGILKAVGAGYLILMGVRQLCSRSAAFAVPAAADADAPAPPDASAPARTWLRTYGQGVLTNVLNPKIVLFFLAFLPQFIATPNRFGAVPFLILGLTYTVLSTAWTLVLVAIASPFSRLLAARPHAGRITSLLAGCIYLALGAVIFFTA